MLKGAKSKTKIPQAKQPEEKKKKISIRELGVTITNASQKKTSKSKGSLSTKKGLISQTSAKKLPQQQHQAPQNKKEKDKSNFTCNYGL